MKPFASVQKEEQYQDPASKERQNPAHYPHPQYFRHRFALQSDKRIDGFASL
jgi:hypothetical protein